MEHRGIEAVKAWVAARGGAVSFHELPAETPTVAATARVLGVPPEAVMKSLVFLVAGASCLIIANGERRVSERRLAEAFGVGRKRVRMASAEEAFALTGFRVGRMPPFGHARPLPTLLDRAALEQERLWGGAGDPLVLCSLTPGELARLTEARILEISEGG